MKKTNKQHNTKQRKQSLECIEAQQDKTFKSNFFLIGENQMETVTLPVVSLPPAVLEEATGF